MDYKSIFQNSESKAIMVVGDIMLDSYIWGDVDRISPEAPVPVVNVDTTEDRLGGAANVVKNIASLGMKPVICSVVGNDSASDKFFSILKKRNIDSQYCVVDSTRKTTVKTRVICGKQQMLRIDSEQTDEISEETRIKLQNNIQKAITEQKIAAIILQDYDKGVFSKKLIEFVVAEAKKNSIPVLVDPKKRNFSNFQDVTLFKPNFKEFTEGLGKSCRKNDSEAIFALAKEFMQKQNIDTMMITLSELGIFIADKDHYVQIPTQVRHVSDVSGAGDTVISTASVCYVLGFPIEEIARISNIAGGIVCEQPGVVTIEKEQLIQHI
ncbi:MAG: PfkB family carbohydrate kinase [Bacteroidales bacterium]|nr:PfkB family carbohydrate kinase [Bacteroidales bacterium]